LVIIDELAKRLSDTDELVRQAAISSVADVLKTHPLNLHTPTIDALAQRMLDKKVILNFYQP